MSKKRLPKLPRIIKVKIIKTKEGFFIAELPKYDIFTEGDNFFDVPKKYHGKIVYRRVVGKKEDLKELNIPVAFKVFCTPKSYHECSSWL